MTLLLDTGGRWLGGISMIGLVMGCTLDRDGANAGASTTNGGAGAGAGGSATTSTTGGAATGADGGGGSGAVGGGGEGGCMPTENCQNGVDDDCDRMVDCEDPDCSDFMCVPTTTGASFVQVSLTAGACAAGLVEQEVTACRSCGCTVTNNGTCTNVVDLWTNSSCNGAAAVEDFVLDPSGCTAIALTADAGQNVAGKMVDVKGNGDVACDPTGEGQASDSIFLCGLDDAGTCADGDACVPNGLTDACIVQDGDQSCPAAYPFKELVHDAASTGACACDCASAMQTCPTNNDVHTHSELLCADGKGADIKGIDNQCDDTGRTVIASLENHSVPLPATGGTCSSFGVPAGATGQRTLCCSTPPQ